VVTQSRKISTAWHPNWALKTQQAEPGKLTTWVYNGQPDPFNNNATASCVTNTFGGATTLPDGNPIAVLCKKVEQATTDATGSQGLSATLDNSDPNTVWQRQWSYTYTEYGQVLTSVDPLGNTTSYTYYTDAGSFTGTAPNEQGHTKGDLKSVSNAKGQATTYDLYDRAGRVLQSTDPNSLVSTYSYTPRGWLKSVNVGGLLTSYDYWPTGLLKKATQPDGTYLYYQYDDAHRLTDIADAVDASGNLTGNKVHYTLDNAGNRLKEDVSDSGNNLLRNITRSYDALNRLQTAKGALQ
jgi:YD repeat-containing protein